MRRAIVTRGMGDHGIVCERARAWAALQPDGELSSFEQRLLTAHLDRCEPCLTFAQRVEAATLALRNAPAEPLAHPVSVSRAARFAPRRLVPRRTVYSTAAAAAAAVMALSISSGVDFAGGDKAAVRARSWSSRTATTPRTTTRCASSAGSSSPPTSPRPRASGRASSARTARNRGLTPAAARGRVRSEHAREHRHLALLTLDHAARLAASLDPLAAVRHEGRRRVPFARLRALYANFVRRADRHASPTSEPREDHV